MSQEYVSFRCPRCGKVLIASELPEYVYQCMECDEDFYAFEAVKVVSIFSEPTLEEQRKYDDDGFCVDLSQTVKVSVSDEWKHSGYCYMAKSDVERLGLDYIKDHVRLEYSEVLEEYFVRMSQNDWYNDTQRNPERLSLLLMSALRTEQAVRFTKAWNLAAIICAKCPAVRSLPSG